MERRITENDRHENKLKTIAGLLQKLSYREMGKLAGLLQSKAPNDVDYPDALLSIADELLKDGK